MRLIGGAGSSLANPDQAREECYDSSAAPTPRYVAVTRRSARKAAGVPSKTIAPWSITYTRSASPSAISAFCSTSSMLTRSRLSSAMVPMTASRTSGASPCEGSSRSSSSGPVTSARDGEHLLRAAREEPPLAIEDLAELGKAFEHGVRAPARVGPPRNGEMLARREVREDAAGLRHQRDAQAGDLVCRSAREARALVEDLAFPRRGQPGDRTHRRGLAGTVAAEQRDDLALAHVQGQAMAPVGATVVRVDGADVEDQGTATPPR